MARKRTGLRNKSRPNGRSSYFWKGKSASRDRYGEFVNGVQKTPDQIAGHNLTY